jgi:hypothetical protein
VSVIEKGKIMKIANEEGYSEAVRWEASKTSWDEIMKLRNIKWKPGEMGSNSFYVETLDGFVLFTKGDYIIRKSIGEFEKCEGDVFNITYEKV